MAAKTIARSRPKGSSNPVERDFLLWSRMDVGLRLDPEQRIDVKIKDTAKSRNIEIEVVDVLSLDEMEAALAAVASEMGLYYSRITILGAKRYPGNRHWHLKRHPKENGCLDVTYWPQGSLLWVSIRNYEPAWVHEAGQQLKPALEEYLREYPAPTAGR